MPGDGGAVREGGRSWDDLALLLMVLQKGGKPWLRHFERSAKSLE